MKTDNNLTKYMRPSLLLLFSVVIFGCGPEFDDPTMAVLKKPEILSIVLEPPEAAPGETVSAAFLMADEKGVIEGNASMWLPMGASEMSETEMTIVLEGMGLNLESLREANLEFTVPSKSRFAFDEEGLSGQMLSLFAAKGDTPGLDATAEEFMNSLNVLMESGEVKTALRTLVVSERVVKNQNPSILSIIKTDSEAGDTPVTLVQSDSQDIAVARRLARDNPLIVTRKQNLVFDVEVEDDGKEENLRYQWISTGGDFAGLRKKVQKFKASDYRELEKGDQDQSGQENVNPRIDPNLHPVWLVVRDNGIPGALGQAWAEFYIRVIEEE